MGAKTAVVIAAGAAGRHKIEGKKPTETSPNDEKITSGAKLNCRRILVSALD